MNNKKYLTFDDFMEFIDMMSYSQGFYGRLKRDIATLDADSLEDFKETVEAQKFTNPLDIVYWLEC